MDVRKTDTHRQRTEELEGKNAKNNFWDVFLPQNGAEGDRNSLPPVPE